MFQTTNQLVGWYRDLRKKKPVNWGSIIPELVINQQGSPGHTAHMFLSHEKPECYSKIWHLDLQWLLRNLLTIFDLPGTFPDRKIQWSVSQKPGFLGNGLEKRAQSLALFTLRIVFFVFQLNTMIFCFWCIRKLSLATSHGPCCTFWSRPSNMRYSSPGDLRPRGTRHAGSDQGGSIVTK